MNHHTLQISSRIHTIYLSMSRSPTVSVEAMTGSVFSNLLKALASSHPPSIASTMAAYLSYVWDGVGVGVTVLRFSPCRRTEKVRPQFPRLYAAKIGEVGWAVGVSVKQFSFYTISTHTRHSRCECCWRCKGAQRCRCRWNNNYARHIHDPHRMCPRR